MTPTLLFGIVLGLAIAIVIYKLFGKKKLPKSILRQQRNKGSRKGEILLMFNNKKEITNNDVEWALGVADSTATRYLQELEDEGKIIQIGERGKYVHYKKT